MTTSGTYTFNYSRDQIIRAALRKLGAIQAGETPGPQLTTDCADQLNAMVKHWMTSGIHIWTETEAIMYTVTGQAIYPLGAGTPTQAYTVNTQTITTAASVLGATVIPLSTSYLAANGGTVGITLDSGIVQWTTISSFTSTSITIPGPGLLDSVQQYQVVYMATSGIVRPLRIPACRRWDSLSGEETTMTALSKLDYQNLPNKNIQGTVTQWYYNPQGGANNVGLLYLWPTPSTPSNNSNVKFTWYRPIQDFNTAANTPDLPQEWINCLIWNLAYYMAPEFGVPAEVFGMIKEEAALTLDDCKGWDKEPESTYFGVDFSRMGG